MHLYSDPAIFRREAAGAVLAIGNFDGVHLGHQAVIKRAAEIAQKAKKALAVLTFDPHPSAILRPQTPPFTLTPLAVKARYIKALGVENLVVIRFKRSFSALSAQAFAEQVLVQQMGIGHAVIGHDFSFGKGREGTPKNLTDWLARHAVPVCVVEPVTDPQLQIYASSRIRVALETGDLETATQALGKPWLIEGIVKHGDARGRILGFPTANIALGSYLRPAAGVYAVQVQQLNRINPDSWMAGVANIGTRPTVRGKDLRLEVHLFDRSDDFYGQILTVALIRYLRPETKFADLEALITQITADCEMARSVLLG